MDKHAGGSSHSKLLSQKFFSAKQTANSSERVEIHEILVPFSSVPLPLRRVHPDGSDYPFRQQGNKQCLSEVSNNESIGGQLMFEA